MHSDVRERGRERSNGAQFVDSVVPARCRADMPRHAITRVLVFGHVAMNADEREGMHPRSFCFSVLHARWNFLTAEPGDRALHARE